MGFTYPRHTARRFKLGDFQQPFVMKGFHESGKASSRDCKLTIANSVRKAAAKPLYRQENRTRR